MGTERTSFTGLAEALFTPVQGKVLGLLFGQPQRRFQSAELIRLADSGTGATHRLLRRLADSGLLRVSIDGHQKYYQANPDSPVFEELAGLIRKTIGLAAPLQDALAPFGTRIRTAFIYGSIAGGTDRADSDIDLVVITDDLDYPMLYEALQDAERRLARRVDPTVMTMEEWRRKLAERDSFVSRIRARPRLLLIGSDVDLQ